MFFQNNSAAAQSQEFKSGNFRKIVEKKLAESRKTAADELKSPNKLIKTADDALLEKVCPIDSDAVARRVFIEYGAVFVAAKDVHYPTKCIFDNENEVQVYQNNTDAKTVLMDGAPITLQKSAMDALLAAQIEAARFNLQITPRGGSIAGRRSYQDTARLWNSRFYPALSYWLAKGRISRQEFFEVRNLPIHQQVKQVLEWEKDGIYFSTDFSKSILYSVAAPGASQHIFMIALDVREFDDLRVRNILAEHGWYQTVKSDFPHFTYLGIREADLPAFGLKPFLIDGHKFWLTDVDF